MDKLNNRQKLMDFIEREIYFTNFRYPIEREYSYDNFLDLLEKMCNLNKDRSLSIQTIVAVVNIVDNLNYSLKKAYTKALRYLESWKHTPDRDENRKVYIVQFDWATPDCDDTDFYVYDSYDKAYDKFKELICNERSERSWVGAIEFDDEGYPVDEHYEFEFEDNNSCESEVYWHIRDKNDRFMHSFIDLRVMEVK